MNESITTTIENMTQTLLPNGGGSLSVERLHWALEQVAQVAYAEGQAAALLSLRTADDAAKAWGVSGSRARAHIAKLNARHGVGMRIGQRVWLLTAAEVERYKPNAHAPRK